MKRVLTMLLIASCWIALTACASEPVVRPVSPTAAPAPANGEGGAEALYQKAEVYLRNNFMAKALEQYLLVVERFPHSPQAPMALYQIGQIQLRTNAFDQALYYFNLLASEHPDDPLAVEAYFEMGVCQQRLGRYDQAVQSFGYYVHADRAKRPDEAKILLGDSYVVLRRYGDALLAYASCDPHLDSARQVDVLKKVRDLLEGKIQLTELLGLIPRLNDGPVADFARFRAAEELMSHGQQAEAARLLRDMKFADRRYKFYAKAEELLQRAEAAAAAPPPARTAPPTRTAPPPTRTAPSTRTAPPTRVAAPESAAEAWAPEPICAIGVLLPLSGEAGVFGREVLHGVMLGAGLFGDRDPTACRVIVRDTQGDPQAAVQAVNDLADDPQVLAIIGPLLSKTAPAAAEAAEKRGIPLISLTARELVTEGGHWTFRNFLTADDQVRALARYAAEQQGAARFAILYPDDEQGRMFRDLFRRAVASTPGRLVAAVGYRPDETDFRQPIAQLKAAGHFDALFIPDNHRRVALLAPQLVYYDVKDVMLLGINRWNDDELARMAGGYLQRAVLVDGFFARASNPEVEPFVTAFRNEFGQTPTFLAAVGFDTARLLRRLLARAETHTREGVRAELMRLDGFAGVTGELSMGEDRNVHRRLYLLRVGPTAIEELY